jgi:hypothetical protein
MPLDKKTEKLLTAEELIERWGGRVKKGTLNNWRYQGRGPDFVKPFGRVLYPLSKVLEWEQANMLPADDESHSDETDT